MRFLPSESSLTCESVRVCTAVEKGEGGREGGREGGKLMPTLMPSCSFSGEPQSFRVQVNSSANYPLDFYILMDLSGSMVNDLATLQSLSNLIGMLLIVFSLLLVHVLSCSLLPPSVDTFSDIYNDRLSHWLRIIQ